MVNLTLRFSKSCFFLPIAIHVISSVEKTNAKQTNCKYKPVIEELKEYPAFYPFCPGSLLGPFRFVVYINELATKYSLTL